MKRILLATVFLFASGTMMAQWVTQPSNVTAGMSVQFIDAVSPTVCWGLAVDPLDQMAPIQEFTRTVDGLTWQNGFISNATGLCPSNISAINADTAWVAMFEPFGFTGKILRTDDGGLNWNWQSTALFNLAGNFPNFVHFWDGNSGVCMGDPTLGYFEIYTSVDGGTNWIRVPQADIAPILAGEFGITDVFTTQGDSSIWFGTNKGRIYRSTDRGFHWTAHATPYVNLFIGAIAFRDDLNGLAVPGSAPGSTSPARTTDGGITWTSVGSNTAGMTLMQSMAYLPGSDSTYMVTSPFAGSINGSAFSPNDGSGWVLVDNLFHSGIDFVNDSVGWTGSFDANSPMYKWETPIVLPSDEVATLSIDVPPNTGMILQNPQATFTNNGINVASFNVTMNISGGYTSTKVVSSLAFGADVQVTFDPWTPAAIGPYTVQVYTSLAGDSDNSNDTLNAIVTVFEALATHGWISKPAVPTAAFGAASAFNLIGNSSSSDGNLYSIGGAMSFGVSASTRFTSTLSNTWFTPDSMPTEKYQFSAQKVGGFIVCSGGYSTGFTVDGNTYLFNLTTGTWSIGAPMPNPVGDYASGVYRDSLVYFIGGFDGFGDQNIVQIYDVTTNTWTTATAKPGTAVAGLRGSINNGNIVVAGGFSQILAGVVSEAHKGVIDPSNPTLITWTTLANYPGGTAARLGAGTVFMDFLPVIIFTGGDPDGAGTSVKEDCWAYDVVQNKWLICPNKITGVSNISDLVGIIHDDSLWMASLCGFDGGILTSVNEWLNLGQFLWTGLEQAGKNSPELVAYPNPAHNTLNIVLNNDQASTLLITDVSGRTLAQREVEKGRQQVQVDIASFATGIYLVRATGSDGVSVYMKFVKE